MNIRNKILLVFLFLSVVLNVFQWSVLKGLFVVNSRVEFSNELPTYTEDEKELIRKAAPALSKLSALSASFYVDQIEETKEHYIFHFSTLSRLRDYRLSITGFPGGRASETFDGCYTMHFNKEMELQKINNAFGNEFLNEK